MGGALAVIDGAFGAYETDSTQRVAFNIYRDWNFFGRDAYIAVFAFVARSAKYHGSFCDRFGIMAFMDVGDLSPMAAGERKS